MENKNLLLSYYLFTRFIIAPYSSFVIQILKNRIFRIIVKCNTYGWNFVKKKFKTCMWALAHSHGLKLEKYFPQLLQQLLPTVWISSLVLHNFQPIPIKNNNINMY